jgi:hypothetical protein
VCCVASSLRWNSGWSPISISSDLCLLGGCWLRPAGKVLGKRFPLRGHHVGLAASLPFPSLPLLAGTSASSCSCCYHPLRSFSSLGATLLHLLCRALARPSRFWPLCSVPPTFLGCLQQASVKSFFPFLLVKLLALFEFLIIPRPCISNCKPFV